MNRVLSVEVRHYYRWGIYSFDPGVLDEPSEVRIVAISEFVLKELEIEHRYNIRRLARVVWEYGDVVSDLQSDWNEKNDYNEEVSKLYE